MLEKKSEELESLKTKEIAIEESQIESKVKEGNQVSNIDEQADVQKDDLSNFDWESFEQDTEDISPENRKELEDLYNSNLKLQSERDVVVGEIIKMTDREVIVDINSKSEGVISLNEFRYNQELKVGDKVEVLIDKMEDKAGQLVLSHKKARLINAWKKINEVHESGEIVTGYITSRTKGGMIVDLFGIEAFLPGSQIDVKQIKDYDVYVNKNMEFKVVKINHEFKNVVVSHKVLIEADIEEQKKEIISKLEKGLVLEGVVKNITSYGVFIDLGGVDGLVHITDLSWSRIDHPSEILELDQSVKVVILDFDEGKSKIQLGMKQLQNHPWENLDENLKIGDKVNGKISVLADYGAFMEIIPGVEGLIHVSEMSWSTHLRSAQDFVQAGDEVEAVILTLDREERKMSLGIKQLTPDPWTDIATKYVKGTTVTGTIRNFTSFGAFVELEEGVDGLIHITDISWNEKVKHPSDFFEVGQKIESVVLELDAKERKLSLGHKQLKESPWVLYEKKYSIGTKFKAKVHHSFEKGATVLFDEDLEKLEAFIPARHTEKEDGSRLIKGEEADFVVIEFSKEAKRIVLSHKETYQTSDKKSYPNTNKSTKSNEKSKLGDLEVLTNLKKKMEDNK